MIRYVHKRDRKSEDKDPSLTLGKTYLVFGVTFRPNSLQQPTLVSILRDSDETPALFEIQFFDIVNEHLPDNWIFYPFKHFGVSPGYYELSPKEFTGDFWDRFHDSDEQAEKIFQQVKKKLEQFHAVEDDC